MTAETMSKCLKIIKTTWPSKFKGQDDAEVFAQWFMLFQEIDDQKFVQAVRLAVVSSKFCPTFPEMFAYLRRAEGAEYIKNRLPEPAETRTEDDREFMAEIMEWCGYTHEAAIATAWADVEGRLTE